MSLQGMRLTHPGESIRDSMEALGWTEAELAEHLGVCENVSDLLGGQAGITPATALALERIGWSNADFWMRRQATYDLHQARRSNRTEWAAGELNLQGWKLVRVVVNDVLLHKKHNPWIAPLGSWEVAFLLLEQQRIQPVRFEPIRGASPYALKACGGGNGNNLERWNGISQGACKKKTRRYLGLAREIS